LSCTSFRGKDVGTLSSCTFQPRWFIRPMLGGTSKWTPTSTPLWLLLSPLNSFRDEASASPLRLRSGAKTPGSGLSSDPRCYAGSSPLRASSSTPSLLAAWYTRFARAIVSRGNRLRWYLLMHWVGVRPVSATNAVHSCLIVSRVHLTFGPMRPPRAESTTLRRQVTS
jgi:hypothetical protein